MLTQLIIFFFYFLFTLISLLHMTFTFDGESIYCISNDMVISSLYYRVAKGLSFFLISHTLSFILSFIHWLYSHEVWLLHKVEKPLTWTATGRPIEVNNLWLSGHVAVAGDGLSLCSSSLFLSLSLSLYLHTVFWLRSSTSPRGLCTHTVLHEDGAEEEVDHLHHSSLYYCVHCLTLMEHTEVCNWP